MLSDSGERDESLEEDIGLLDEKMSTTLEPVTHIDVQQDSENLEGVHEKSAELEVRLNLLTWYKMENHEPFFMDINWISLRHVPLYCSYSSSIYCKHISEMPRLNMSR